MKKFFQENWTIIVLGTLLLAGSLIRLKGTIGWMSPSNYDTGRDLLVVKDIVVNKNPTLIGPTTGVPGVFHGVWWYYFLAIPFWLMSGDPRSSTLAVGVWGILGIVFAYLAFKEVFGKKRFGLVAAGLVTVLSHYIGASTSASNPNLIPPSVPVWLFLAYRTIKDNERKWYISFGLGLVSGFIFEANFAAGAFLLLASLLPPFVYRKKNCLKNLKHALLTALGILFMVSPKILFELRHDFFMTKSMLSYILEKEVRGVSLPLIPRILNRLEIFTRVLNSSFPGKLKSVYWLVLTAGLTRAFKHTYKKPKGQLSLFYKYIFGVIIFTFIGFVVFKDTLWDYYLTTLPGLFLPFLTLGVLELNKLGKVFSVGVVIAPLILLMGAVLNPVGDLSKDPGVLKHQVNVVKYVYGQEDQFAYFVYSPAVYPYPYQYLFWWYAQKLQKPAPFDKPKTDRPTFVIIEPDSIENRVNNWYLGNVVGHGKKLNSKIFKGNIRVEKWQFEF